MTVPPYLLCLEFFTYSFPTAAASSPPNLDFTVICSFILQCLILLLEGKCWSVTVIRYTKTLLFLLQVRGRYLICLLEAVCSTAKCTKMELPSYMTTVPPAPARYWPGSQTFAHEVISITSVCLTHLPYWTLLLNRIPRWCARGGAPSQGVAMETNVVRSVCRMWRWRKWSTAESGTRFTG